MNMKATLRLWSLMTTLMYIMQQASAEPYTDTRILQPQDNSLLSPAAKRTKASLSIVNPLDVLRQRIILEMARRRMQENSMQVARNKAILREIGKRTLSEYPPEEPPSRFGSQDGLHYERLPFLRGVSYSSYHRSPMEYDLEPVESRKATGMTSRDANDSASPANEADKPINNHKDISSSSSGSSSRGSNSRSGGELTLAAEQRQLEREQQTQQEANEILHSFANVGPREIKFSDERVLLPNGVGANDGDSDDDDDDDDDRNSENGVDDGDEYFQGSVFPSGREQNQPQQQRPQKDDRLKSEDYRPRYLYRTGGKYFG